MVLTKSALAVVGVSTSVPTSVNRRSCACNCETGLPFRAITRVETRRRHFGLLDRCGVHREVEDSA